ncbi:MAG: WbuC family cupin fold metalloprotein [Candidatus Brocadiaceae bacterium]|nr:WbuC family cupin fold metalloprotein [Candidatus Brocadiaceae bacterium]
MNTLHEHNFIREDTNAKSLSFFCTGKVSFLDHKMLDRVKKIAFKRKENLRISLHTSPDDALHNMIILQHKGTYNKPHCHKKKAETYHIIEGRQTVFVFDEEGGIIDYCEMSKEGVFLYRFAEGYYHMSVPTSEYVIFHESKIGPFVRQGDSIFARWAPSGKSADEVNEYLESIMGMKT